MKTLIVFMVFFLSSLSTYASEYCNWGFAGPSRFSCNGQNYIKGTAACRSGTYTAVFCNERHSQSGKACSEDVDPETMKCHQKLFSVRDEGTLPDNKPAKPIPISPRWPKSGEQAPVSKGPSSKPPVAAKPKVESCVWLPPGVFNHECEGELFVYGNKACEQQGIINHLFCKAIHEGNIQDCINDNEEKTHRCLRALRKDLKPKTISAPATTAPTGTIQ